MKRDDIQRFQERAHAAGHDYRAGSPHLKHQHLYDRFVETEHRVLGDIGSRGLPMTVLEIGAGHGSFVEPALATGCRVTATEMSRPSIDHLCRRYGSNPNFDAVFDDGSLSALGDRRFSLILCVSVLHHIPDYLGVIDLAIERHLDRGGAFLSFQDPLWYPSLGRSSLTTSKLAYLSWRLGQGSYRRGLSTRLRRLQRVYDDANPSDLVEYHVVRNGVDQDAIRAHLSEAFEQVSVVPYWSTQSSVWQHLGERLRRKNTFAIVALGRLESAQHRPEDESSRATAVSARGGRA